MIWAHLFCCKNDLHTLFLSQKLSMHFFVTKRIYAYFFCRENDLHAFFVAKTIYALRPESFRVLKVAIRKVQTFWASVGVMVSLCLCLSLSLYLYLYVLSLVLGGRSWWWRVSLNSQPPWSLCFCLSLSLYLYLYVLSWVLGGRSWWWRVSLNSQPPRVWARV